MSFYTSLQERIKISDNPLGRGGEGNVYEVISTNYKGYVAKIYHSKERRKEREDKLNYMLTNKPQFEDKLSVIWPKTILYQNNQFVGFLMRKANSAIDLTSLCSLRIPGKLGNNWQRKYDRNTTVGLQNRVKVCKNIAAALAQIHKTTQYVLVDIKPENIKVNLKGQVSIIDIDSVEVISENRLVFSADKTSLEYSPAEVKQFNIRADFIEESWDRFSMAVVFYKVLFGLHPFTGTCKAPYDKLVSNEEKIAKGLFPIGKQRNYFQVIPQPHKAFYSIAVAVQKLFLQCFEEGYKTPHKRPTAQEWFKLFDQSPRFDPIDRHYKPKNRIILSKKIPLKKPQISLPTLIKSSAIAAAVIGVTSFGVVQLTSLTLPENFMANPNFTKNQALLKKIKKDDVPVYVGRFKEGTAKIKKGKKYGFITDKGKGLTKYKYDWADNYREGAARAGVNKKYGFVDKKGKEIIPLKYDWVGKFSEGLAKVELDGKTGFIGQDNVLAIPLKFDYASDFVNGFARVKIGTKWGFVNKLGQQIIPARYNASINFRDGLAAVSLGGKWGYINTLGQQVIPHKYHWASSFIEGRARVLDFNGREMYINKLGQIVPFN